ncbi:MAG: hypothetical protein OXG54_00710 [Gammaproteobacteria bacterium]|nr:hypothetical protein [Gammaproteobacteria bacterium]
MRIGILFAVLLISTPQAIAEISKVIVDLPNDVDWVKVSDHSNGDSYLREWIPSGTSIEDTNWLIVEQKFPLKKKTSAKRYIKNMMKLAQSACTDVRYNGPEKLTVEKYKTYWVRIFCAKQHDKPYGLVTEQRVIVEGKTAFVITSELRTAPSSVAGVFTLGVNESFEAHLERMEKSAAVARESVRIIADPGH